MSNLSLSQLLALEEGDMDQCENVASMNGRSKERHLYQHVVTHCILKTLCNTLHLRS